MSQENPNKKGGLVTLREFFTPIPVSKYPADPTAPEAAGFMVLIRARNELYETLKAAAIRRAETFHDEAIGSATLKQLAQLSRGDAGERFWLMIRDLHVNQMRATIGYAPIKSRTRAQRGFPVDYEKLRLNGGLPL